MGAPPKHSEIDYELEEESGKSAIILAAVLIAVSIFSLLYGLQCLIWLEAKSWGHWHPELYQTPRPLPAPAAAIPANESTNFTFYGYEFSVPWKGDYKAEDAGESYTRIRFNAGPVIAFYNPGYLVNTANALKAAAPAQYLELVGVFGQHPFESNAALFDEVYKASPAQLSPFLERRTAVRLNILLLWRLAFGATGRGGIFSFDWGSVRGLQFGDPAESAAIDVRAFDPGDQQLRLLITTAAGSTGKLTESDISQIIFSLRPVPISGK